MRGERLPFQRSPKELGRTFGRTFGRALAGVRAYIRLECVLVPRNVSIEVHSVPFERWSHGERRRRRSTITDIHGFRRQVGVFPAHTSDRDRRGHVHSGNRTGKGWFDVVGANTGREPCFNAQD